MIWAGRILGERAEVSRTWAFSKRFDTSCRLAGLLLSSRYRSRAVCKLMIKTCSRQLWDVHTASSLFQHLLLDTEL